MRITTIVTFMMAVPLIIGCGPARPQNMPETAPCKITVLYNGKPMQGVVVALYYEEGSSSLNIDGTTNASGVAEIKTTWGSYTTKGAPVGTCKVTLNEYFEMPPETVTPEESALWTPQEGARYERERQEMVDKLRTIPKEITNISLTPLSVTIEPRTGGSLTVEVSEYKQSLCFETNLCPVGTALRLLLTQSQKSP